VVEVPSPQSGQIARLCAEPGDIVQVGEALVEFDEGAPQDSGAVINVQMAEAAPARARPKRARPASKPTAGRVKAPPAVRKRAAALGMDLEAVTGTGPGGAITADDLDKAAAGAPDLGELEPVRGVRRAMAVNMARAHAEVVRSTAHDEADVEAWPAGVDVTMRVIRALAAGCAASPALNAWFDARAMGRRLHDKIDLGVAMDTEDGLFVPVLRDVGNRSAAELRQDLERLRDQVKERSVPREDLAGATITLSNFGTLAGKHGVMVVVPPQVAILGTGRIGAQVVAVDGAPAVHRVMPLSLTTDHRVVTGGEGARFLAAAIADLEKPD
jgi:pyruvate dehydrogenase E2 component (dihydrolipoamide acetyltransferase)